MKNALLLVVAAGFLAGCIVTGAGGLDHSTIGESNGTVWSWGRNQHGQLGDGTFLDRAKAVQTLFSDLSQDSRTLDGGESFSVAVSSHGTVWTWGLNDNGQLGTGSVGPDRAVPDVVVATKGTAALEHITSVAAGASHVLAIGSDGTVWAWGLNSSGQLGDGTTTRRPRPIQVAGPGGSGLLAGVKAVAAGRSHSIALTSDGSVWAWGDNSYGQLGDGLSPTAAAFPVQVVGPSTGALSSVKAIAAGRFHSLAVRTDGTAWAWGLNSEGQLGDGTTDSRSRPVQVAGIMGVSSISGGAFHSAALLSNGKQYTWGNNTYGQLGNGTVAPQSVPQPLPGNFADAGGIATGAFHNLMTDGTSVWAWGLNTNGQVGNGGRASPQTRPVKVEGIVDPDSGGGLP